MNTLLHPISTWCKRGAWFVAALGLIGVIVEIYLFVRSSSGAPLSAVLVQLIPPVVSIVSNFVFYSLILYAAGVIIDRFFTYTETRSTPVSTNEERGDLTRGTVEDSASWTSKAEASQKESDVVEDAEIEPAATSAEAASDVTQETVEDATIKPGQGQAPTLHHAEEASDVSSAREDEEVAAK